MRMRWRPSHEEMTELRGVLRQGDPAAGESLMPEEAATVRRALLAPPAAARAYAGPASWRPRWAAVAATAGLAAALGFLLWPWPQPHAAVEGRSGWERGPAAAAAAAAEPAGARSAPPRPRPDGSLAAAMAAEVRQQGAHLAWRARRPAAGQGPAAVQEEHAAAAQEPRTAVRREPAAVRQEPAAAHEEPATELEEPAAREEPAVREETEAALRETHGAAPLVAGERLAGGGAGGRDAAPAGDGSAVAPGAGAPAVMAEMDPRVAGAPAALSHGAMPARVSAAAPAVVRQVQFSTRGGTRIIWIMRGPDAG
jgi:hypothetical protein